MSPSGGTLLDSLRGGLVVSCQSNPGEAFHSSDAMAMFARAASSSGAVGIRAQGLADIKRIQAEVPLPVVGLWKAGSSGVFITPTLRHALAIAAIGTELVAIDGTRRPRPDGLTLSQTVTAFREQSEALLMADVATLDDALDAEEAGVDTISTTLAGYTEDSGPAGGTPDFKLLQRITDRVALPVFAEGRIRTPKQAAVALGLGAHAVVVGTAITDPTSITSWFVQAMAESGIKPATVTAEVQP